MSDASERGPGVLTMNSTEADVAREAGERAEARSAREASRDLTPAERRRHPRFACPSDASVRLQASTSARVLDLGLGGALVESSTRLVPGSMTALVFNTPDVAFRVRTRVSRVFVSGFTGAGGGAPLLYRAGLEFEPLPPVEAGAMEAFVSELARAAGGGQATGCPSELDRAVPWLLPEGVTEAPDLPTVVIPATSGPGVEPAPVAVYTDRPFFIRFPAGWATTTRKRSVIARAPDERGYMFLGAPRRPSRDLREFARASMHEAGLSVLHCEPAEINGLAACLGFATGWLDEVGAVMIEAAYVLHGSQTYLIAGVAPWAAYETVQHEFFATINSFGGPLDSGPRPPTSSDIASGASEELHQRHALIT